jgi:hypothetical protein
VVVVAGGVPGLLVLDPSVDVVDGVGPERHEGKCRAPRGSGQRGVQAVSAAIPARTGSRSLTQLTGADALCPVTTSSSRAGPRPRSAGRSPLRPADQRPRRDELAGLGLVSSSDTAGAGTATAA